MTSQLQVLDVVVNTSCYHRLSGLQEACLPSGKCPLKTAGNIKIPSAALHGQWIKSDWNDNSPKSTAKGFKECCVLNYMNGMEDHILWVEHNEENSSLSDESVGSNQLVNSVTCL
jgi:hypothetical protein